jgi:HlyD family secretion protein
LGRESAAGEVGAVNNNHGRPRKRRLLIGGGVSLLFLIALALFFGSRSNAAIDPSKLAAVERGDIARSVVATGKIQPLAKVEVKSKASGIVKEILADYGDRVKKGQVLVELDKEELEARVREARATLLSSQAALERTQVEALGPDLPFLKASMERARKLFTEGLLSDSVREEAEKNYELALNKPRWLAPRPPSSAPTTTCGTPPSGAPWKAWCCPGTWRWATPSAPSWSWAPRPPC